MLQIDTQHEPHPYFRADGAHLLIGGRTVESLAAETGRTPFYAYDRSVMSRKLAELRAALPAGIHLHYAMKANPMPAVVQHMAALVDGIDVASGGELRVALDTVMDPAKISFAGPGKGEAELSCAIAAGACRTQIINADSAMMSR